MNSLDKYIDELKKIAQETEDKHKQTEVAQKQELTSLRTKT